MLKFSWSVIVVKLLLAEGPLGTGDAVEVGWSGLLDHRGGALQGLARVPVR